MRMRCRWLAAGVLGLVVALAARPAGASEEQGWCGTLSGFKLEGEPIGLCPLRQTDVRADVSGLFARVYVTQVFENPYAHKIEAVYTFPLSEHAAVDDMTMTIGERVIRGQIKEREEAARIYEEAKRAGHVASRLDQERPNVFTQYVANLEPGARIEIRLQYVERLDWEDGLFTFVFPTVVGPRYMPGHATGKSGTGWSPDTDQVPDASRISPPVTPPGTRSGHDIRIAVNLDGGSPIRSIDSPQHAIDVAYSDPGRTAAEVRLREQAEIPNRDFVLKFSTASDEISDALFTHTDERGRFFTLVLQPPQRVRPEWVVPREVVFVIDKSGSMRGFPIETAKQMMRMCIENLLPEDTFNLMTFEGGVGFCFPSPVPNSESNRRTALQYLAGLQGGGGTEMMNAIHACLSGAKDPGRLRVVCFMTDGYVGNDMAIIDAVGKNVDTARVFSFGIGSSVNRFLLDGIARAGNGDVEYVLSPDQASEASMRFYQRIRTPVLTDVRLEWSGVEVEQVYPQRLPDLFSARPIVVHGRYTTGGPGNVTLRGRRGTELFERRIDVTLPPDRPGNDALASLWARARVEDLMNRDLDGVQRGRPDPGLREHVVALALKYRLLTQFTSFVAVEERYETRGGEAVRVTVPVEMPQGVSYEGVFGRKGEVSATAPLGAPPTASKAMRQLSADEREFDLGISHRAQRRARPDAGFDGAGLGSAEQPVDELRDKDAGWEAKLDDELHGQLAAKRGASERVEIAVRLGRTDEETLARMMALGFTVLHRSEVEAGLVIGTIEWSRLEDLARLEAVERIAATEWSSMQ